MKYELLGNIIEVSKGKKHNIVEVPGLNSKRIIGIKDLRNDTNIVFTDDSNGVLACGKDILIAWDGANAGTIGFGKEGFIGSTISRLRIKNTKKYSEIFLGKLLQSKFGYLRSTATGATIPHINRAALDSIKVPQFDLTYQIRIVTVLTLVEGLIAKRKESTKLLDELLKSTFLEMFGDPVRNEKGWEKKRIDEIANTRLGKMRDKQFFTGKHLNYYLGNSNVRWFSFDFDKLEKMDFDENEQVKFSLQYGDLLICEGGEIGRCAIWKCEKKKMYFQKALHRVRVYNELVHQEYLAYVFYLYSLGNGFKNVANKATISHLTGEKLKETLVPIPPLPLQKQFVAMVGAVDSLKAKYKISLAELENLYGSLSQRAFKGELDLSKISLEALSESMELKEKKKEISSVNIEFTESKKYSEVELLQIIQSLPGGTFSFDTLMIAIETASFIQMPEYGEVKDQIYRMLEGANPPLSQYFDKTKREILLRVNP